MKREGSKLNTIKITINDKRIEVWDNGGIPVIKHKEYNEWIPEMIFSNLKAGSFDDTEEICWYEWSW
jgi:DNA gyrase/topoisomerase IV subunit B